jgi:hypothetical protein
VGSRCARSPIRRAGIESLGLPRSHLGLRPLPAGTFAGFPTLRPYHSDRSPCSRRRLLDLCRAFRALIYSWNTSRRPRATCVPASLDSRCVPPLHRLSACMSTPSPRQVSNLWSDGSHRQLSFRPRGSSPPQRFPPHVASVGLLHPTSGPEVRRVFDFPFPPSLPLPKELGQRRGGGRHPPMRSHPSKNSPLPQPYRVTTAHTALPLPLNNESPKRRIDKPFYVPEGTLPTLFPAFPATSDAPARRSAS